MKYNPEIHHRRSIRLKGYDYSMAGAYFITICCEKMQCRFGHVDNNKMILNEFGKIANDEWEKLPQRFPNIELDVFQIMPNHIHGIIVLTERNVGATLAVAQNNETNTNIEEKRAEVNRALAVAQNNETKTNVEKRAEVNPAPTDANKKTIGDIVGSYKSLVANACLEIFKSRNETMGKLWQRNFHDHIIRNEQSYRNIAEYIMNNPKNWKDDKFYMR